MKKLQFIIDRIENIVGKGENAGKKFSFSHNVFKMLLSYGLLKLGTVRYRVHAYPSCIYNYQVSHLVDLIMDP